MGTCSSDRVTRTSPQVAGFSSVPGTRSLSSDYNPRLVFPPRCSSLLWLKTHSVAVSDQLNKYFWKEVVLLLWRLGPVHFVAMLRASIPLSWFCCLVIFPRSCPTHFNNLVGISSAHTSFPLFKPLMLKFSQYPSIHTNYITPTAPLYNIIIIFDTVLRQKRICKRER